jgi:hypothetical protein
MDVAAVLRILVVLEIYMFVEGYVEWGSRWRDRKVFDSLDCDDTRLAPRS